LPALPVDALKKLVIDGESAREITATILGGAPAERPEATLPHYPLKLLELVGVARRDTL